MKTKFIILLSVLITGLTNGASVAQDGLHPVPPNASIDTPKLIVVNGETYYSVKFVQPPSPPTPPPVATTPDPSPIGYETESYSKMDKNGKVDDEKPALPETLQPIWSMLKGRSGTFVTTLLSWLAVLSAAIAPFAVRLRNRLADALNSKSDKEIDSDGYLRKLFSSTPYRVVAFLLNFINIRFPTLAELERAIALQQEAVAESRQPPRVSGAVRDLQYESRARQLQELDRLLAEAGKIKAALAGPAAPLPVASVKT